MAGDFSELDEWVRGLTRMEAEMAQGVDLFKAHEVRYLNLAKQVGGQTLLAMQPDDVDPEEWMGQVREFESLVFSRLTSRGMEIVYQGRTEEDAQTGKRQVNITYNDVLEWVRAGPENGGKDKTLVENTRQRADVQIAHDVLTATRQQHFGFANKDYSAITERLEQWVNQRVLRGDMGELLEAVLTAWVMALLPVMERDLADWADEVVRW